MNKLDVRIVTLGYMRVASVWGFGEEPERVAWQKLEAWAGPKGYRENPEMHRIFGFNNPNPSPASPHYGYELWMVVDPDAAPEADVRILDFEGGQYAVTRCEVPEGQYDVIGETWKKLIAWREDSAYKTGRSQWLEESIPVQIPGIEFVLDLYLPISE